VIGIERQPIRIKRPFGGGTEIHFATLCSTPKLPKAGIGYSPWHRFSLTTSTTRPAFAFLSGPLAPVFHVARIQWKSFSGLTSCVDDRSLIVMHK
jgi:hypothetical protein